MAVVLRGVELRGLVVELEPGEWYYATDGPDTDPAATARTIVLGDVDRIQLRLRGDHQEMWVGAHKPTCGQRPDHRACIAEYIALTAVERAVAKRDGAR
ncbi:hypothetical protein BDK92_5850 [Micromonospora pisi]|uniref:Uncharacterized protein n=1 Tax=Micromonospora pisi TaxID=589240 RepID=A0A495JSX7_9ACTN|nr:hypothetical protein [Micromonospora pisi]RKR91454.1 hypothetical protein BDK92_5850 [Micromonospora pisi]